MTINDFKKYQSISKTISNLLFNENYSNKHDIKIIFNILLGFPYCLDTEGHYTYDGKFYNSLETLPKEALEQILYRLQHCTMI